jgi:hypothetical protein
MRWGISTEITNSHMTTTICLNEIKNCQKYSVGPNFIALLSHRYGARSLPSRILVNEYKLLGEEIEKNADDYDLSFDYHKEDEESKTSFDIEVKNLFEYCYELDENEIPHRYKIKNMDSLFANYNYKNPIFDKVWRKMETRVGDIMRKAAQRCFDEKKFNETQRERFFVSGLMNIYI